VIEITFRGEDYATVFREIDEFLDFSWGDKRLGKPASLAKPVDKPADIPADIPVDKPVDKPKPDPHANAAAKAAAADRMAKVRAAKAAKASAPKAEPVEAAPEDPVAEKPLPDVSEIIKIRQRTINDLQEAYADGHQKEVFELLSRFGNGAKSFRELTAESFLPIREAIDAGALK
jgi:hypothetical protein